MREQGIMLKHHVGFAYIRWLVIHHGTADTNFTALGGFQSANEPQCGGLAAAAGPEQSKEFTSVDGQTQIVYCYGSVKTFGDVDEFDTGRPRHTMRYASLTPSAAPPGCPVWPRARQPRQSGS